MNATIRILLICLGFKGAVYAAALQNLDFEQTRTNTVIPRMFPRNPGEGIGPVSDLLPGWQLLRDGQPITMMDYNVLGDPFFAVDHISVIGPPLFASVIQGQFSLVLDLDQASSDEYRLVQRGDIPIDAQLLRFQYRQGPLIASVNGQDISPTGLAYGDVPCTVLADISRFAGQNVELSFRPGGGTLAFDISYLDNIGFMVPEPSICTLLALGVIALVVQIRRLN